MICRRVSKPEYQSRCLYIFLAWDICSICYVECIVCGRTRENSHDSPSAKPVRQISDMWECRQDPATPGFINLWCIKKEPKSRAGFLRVHGTQNFKQPGSSYSSGADFFIAAISCNTNKRRGWAAAQVNASHLCGTNSWWLNETRLLNWHYSRARYSKLITPADFLALFLSQTWLAP